jgi:hypothetical protein
VISSTDSYRLAVRSPADAESASGLTPGEFITALRDGRLHPVDIGGGASAFRPEDVDALRTTTP